MWFDEAKSEIEKKHKAAYEKSLKSAHAVKVHEGEYYYKGFNISNDGSKYYPWNYKRPDEIQSESAVTKREAMLSIDYVLGYKEFDLCDIVCV